MKPSVILLFHLFLAACLSPLPALAAEHNNLSPGDHSFVLKVGDLDRHYAVHVPAGYNAKRAAPLVVMLHGGGGTGQAAERETRWDAKADEAGFLAAFPEATPPDLTKPGQFRGNPQTWNDGSGRFHAGDKKIDDIGFLNAMLDDLMRRYAVDRRRVFVTGFSNGASMTFRVGAELSHRIAAIAPVAGACWSDAPRLKQPVSLCYVTGDADPLNPLAGGEPKFLVSPRGIGGRNKPPVQDSIQKWATALGCPTKPTQAVIRGGVKTVTYGPGKSGGEVIFVTVEGLGHNWAGGKNLLPEFMVGKRSEKLKTTDFLWDFFQKHPAPASRDKGD